MPKIGELIVKIGADASGLTKELKKSEGNLQSFSKRMEAIGTKMKNIGSTMTAAVTLPVLAMGAASFKLASDYQESLNKVDVAFQGNAEEVKAWSKTTLKSFGIAKGTALDMAATYGDMATSMGLSTQQAADMSTSMVGLAGDLASFKNIGIDQANTALAGIFTGETESLKQLGIVMTQANLDEYALSQGIKKKTKDLTQAEQVQLRYNYVMEKTRNAQGDFARTGGGAANQMRIFGESLKELGATMGENLLPVITPIIHGINEMIKRFGAMSPATQKMVLAIAGIVAAVGPVLIAIGAMASGLGAVIKIAGAAGKGIGLLSKGFALLTGPVGIAIAIIAGLITIAYLVYKNWDKISKQVAETWQWIKEKAASVWGGIKDFFAKWGLDILGVLLGPVGMLAVQIYKHWDEIKAKTGQKWTDIKTWLVNFVAGFKPAVGDRIAGVKQVVSDAWNAVKKVTVDIWGGIKSFVVESINAIVSTIGGLFDKLDQLRLKAKGVKEGVSWNFTGSGSTMSYAAGTNFHPGGMAWVGEKGPELVNLPRGAQVLSNRDSMAMKDQSLTISGTVRVEGVNNMSQLIGVAEVVAKQIEQGDRRLAGRVRVMPSMA